MNKIKKIPQAGSFKVIIHKYQRSSTVHSLPIQYAESCLISRETLEVISSSSDRFSFEEAGPKPQVIESLLKLPELVEGWKQMAEARLTKYHLIHEMHFLPTVFEDELGYF